ncbi:hypothetical protein [Dyadobacter crusticola]|uniref:hypothetical protein n=1 Tax=Dyadobacter crusticola TaxID=292407 RepID=UPI0004E18E90|nr:hypothetical protein [Dyadobacter crusticola]
MEKKKIRFYDSFEELDADQLRANLDSSLEERWEKFWQLKKLYKELFPSEHRSVSSNTSRKTITILKPEWI